jgi:hypothetical protein
MPLTNEARAIYIINIVGMTDEKSLATEPGERFGALNFAGA